MHFVGLDLAWGEKNSTGVAAIDSNGRLLHLGAAQDDASIEAAVSPYVSDDCVVAIDAPLIVRNPSGCRACETALNHDFTGSTPERIRPTTQTRHSAIPAVPGSPRPSLSTWIPCRIRHAGP